MVDSALHFSSRFVVGGVAPISFVTAKLRGRFLKQHVGNHDAQRWYLKLLLLMPDHLHMLVGIPGDAELSKLIRDFKRITARIAKINWQRNYFDHRLRHDESEDEKAAYIRANPIRAGLIAKEEDWPFVISEVDLEQPRAVR